MTTHVAPAGDRARRAARLAWWSLALFPLSFIGAFLVGEGLLSLTGHGSGATQPPLWAVVVAAVPALVVFAAPAVLTVHFGRQAMRLGSSAAQAPVVIALTVAGGFTALNLLAYVAGLVWGG